MPQSLMRCAGLCDRDATARESDTHLPLQSITSSRVACTECLESGTNARDAHLALLTTCQLKCEECVSYVKLQSPARSQFTMAPKRGLSIERTSEYEEFMKDLAAYHEKRGYVTRCA